MKDLNSYASKLQPIYSIMLMEKSGAETIKYDSGKDSGMPDTGTTDYPGFYYSLEDALHAMHENICDIRECVYDYGYVLRHLPGMYGNLAGSSDRIYFKWDEARKGYYEADEPELMKMLEL